MDKKAQCLICRFKNPKYYAGRLKYSAGSRSTPLAVKVLLWQSKYSSGRLKYSAGRLKYSAGSQSTPLWLVKVSTRPPRHRQAACLPPSPALDTAVSTAGYIMEENSPNSWSADVDLGRTDGAEHQHSLSQRGAGGHTTPSSNKIKTDCFLCQFSDCH